MDGHWTVPGYRHVRTLGAGASGTVVLAVHEATGAPAAIKYLAEKLRGDARFLDQFRAEARLMAGLTDPHVVGLYEYVETERAAALVMELVNGVTVKEILGSEGATGPEAALVVLKGSLLGLAAAHAAGVVHRDYKPANVLVGEDGMSKLADFGIAVRADEQATASGTPAYMAPEQWTSGAVGPATDVYAATAVCFECLTGERPYPVEGLWALAAAHRLSPIPVEQVPEPLRGLIARGLAKDPADRPQSAQRFLQELEEVAATGYGPGWEERGRARLAALAGLLAALFPLAQPLPAGGTALGLTRLGRGRLLAVAGVTAVALAAGSGGGYVLAGIEHGLPMTTTATSTPFPVAEPGTSESPTPTPAGTTPSMTPMSTGTPTVTPTVSSAPTVVPSSTPTLSPSVVPDPKPTIVKPPPTIVTDLALHGVTITSPFARARGYVATAAVTVTVSGPGPVNVTVTFFSRLGSASASRSVIGAGTHRLSLSRVFAGCPGTVRAVATAGGRADYGSGSIQCLVIGKTNG